MPVRHTVPTLRGEIGGVVRSVTGAALPGVCVTAAGMVAGRPEVVSAISGAGGRYLVAGLLRGRYRVNYRPCGGESRYLGRWYSGSVLVGAGRPTVLRQVALRPVALRPAGSGQSAGAAARKAGISGTVTTTTGKRLGGVCVDATSKSGDEDEESTGRDGTYSLSASDITPGRWIVGFSAECGSKVNVAPQWWKFASKASKARVLVVGKHSHFTGIDARLGAGAALSGVVRAGTKSGPGLRGVCVQVSGIGPVADVFGFGISGPGGKFRVAGLGTGRYQVTFDPCNVNGDFVPSSLPQVVAVTDGKTTKGINWFLPPGAEISGTVTAGPSHAPVRGICVEADSTNSLDGFGAAVTGPDGRYEIDGLVAAKYAVSFSAGCGSKGSFAPTVYDNEVSEGAADVLSLSTGQHLTGIDVTMPKGGVVTGTVTDSSGHLLTGACVSVTSTADLTLAGVFDILVQGGGGPGLPGFAVTKAGQYRVPNLLPGNYTVSFGTGCRRSAPSLAAQWFAPQGGSRPAVLTVGTGTVSGVDAKLSAPGVITGVVRTPSGQPAREICVTPVGVSGEPSNLLDDLVGGFALPETGKTGAYQITGLAPGQYEMLFQPCGATAYAQAWYKQAGSEASAQPVTVGAGHTRAGVDQKMIVGTSISGRITSASSGKPVAGRCVLVVDARGNLAGLAVDKANGDYAIANLAPASYVVEAEPCLLRSGGLATGIKPDVRLRRSGSDKGVSFALPEAGAIAGQVTGGNPAAPLGGMCVVATTLAGVQAGPAFTNSTGRYVLGGLAPGKYGLEFSSLCAGGAGGFVDAVRPQVVAVASAATTSGVDATLVADGGISGTVRSAGSGAAGVCVLAWPAIKGNGDVPVVSLTDAQGDYQVSGLAPGSYVVEFTGCGGSKFRTQWFDGVGARAGATPVAVTAGMVTGGIGAH